MLPAMVCDSMDCLSFSWSVRQCLATGENWGLWLRVSTPVHATFGAVTFFDAVVHNDTMSNLKLSDTEQQT